MATTKETMQAARVCVCVCGPRKRTGRLERSLARGAYNYTRLPRLLSIGRTSIVTHSPIMPPTCRTRGEECVPGSRGRVRFTACCFGNFIVAPNVPLILSINAEECIANFYARCMAVPIRCAWLAFVPGATGIGSAMLVPRFACICSTQHGRVNEFVFYAL